MIRQSRSITIITFLLSVLSDAKVSLNSSADSACPGDTLVFTCTTDTGSLLWSTGGANELFYGSSGEGTVRMLNNITVNLTSVTGMMLVSTATVYNVSIEENKKIIECSDSSLPGSNSAHKMVKLSDPLSPPLNLTSSYTLSFVTISWVAPLDTPLCVHSYTVTVRYSCNPSQVMVYNTTDNRSSLNITDLTSDGKYSVTVAGRDGAGRLGQESEELKIIFSLPQIELFGYDHLTNSVQLKWKLLKQLNCFPLVHYRITHNVSSDQSPITTNRTNVTLYGVQPGETYTVEITPYVQLRAGETRMFTFNADCNCSHQQWTVAVPWVLLVVVIAIAMTVCCILIQIIIRVKSKLQDVKKSVKEQQSISKTSSKEAASSYDNINVQNQSARTSNIDKEVGLKQSIAKPRIYDEVNDVVDHEMSISTKTNMAYTAVKQ